MKQTLLGIMLGITICIATAGVIEEWGTTFSPRHTAAIALVTLDQINVLRAKAGLANITTNQMLTAMNTKYQGLADEFYAFEHRELP
jgi:hypothetical protein